jgi:hypothetical protein
MACWLLSIIHTGHQLESFISSVEQPFTKLIAGALAYLRDGFFIFYCYNDS